MSALFFVEMRRATRDWIVPWTLAATLGSAGACTRGVFACDDDDGCKDGEALGACEATGFCSFPDVGCDSGRRYGDLADDGLAGECVPADDATTGTDATSTSATATSATSVTTLEPTGVSDTDAPTTETSAATDSDDTATGDPYGPCEGSNECSDTTAVCVSNGPNRMCAPSCTMPVTPSDECPVSVDPDAEVGCLFTDAEQTLTRCFAVCEQEADCPPGMICVSPVCTWAG